MPPFGPCDGALHVLREYCYELLLIIDGYGLDWLSLYVDTRDANRHRLSVFGYYEGAHLDELPSLQAAGDQTVIIDLRNNGCIKVGEASSWMGLSVINVHYHTRAHVPCRINCLDSVPHNLPVLCDI